jgi:hypothetical protein
MPTGVVGKNSMNRNTLAGVALVLMFVVAFCILATLSGCNRRTDTSVPLPNTLADLAHQIADADNIIITNRFADTNSPFLGVSLSLSGQQVSRIVRAISSARRLEIGTWSVWDWELQFYKATNRLATVDFQEYSFLVKKGEYMDETGVLEKLYREMLERSSLPKEKGREFDK